MSVNIGINIQRSPNRINQNLREAGALGKYPKLLLDFKDEYYLANGGSKTFENAVTHARAGNATMTDGYGPELVTNGGFASDSDWTKTGDWTISDGVAISSGGTGYVYQTNASLEQGKVYLITYTVTSYTSGSVRSGIGNTLSEDAGVLRTSAGTFTDVVVRTASNDAQDFIGVYGVSFVGSIDNVSVREMPVIKWAPHNLMTYSEDFSQWSPTLTTVTTNTATAPDGTQTADQISHTADLGKIRKNETVIANIQYTFSVFAKYVDHQWVAIASNNSASPYFTWFDIQNGLVGTDGSDGATITDVGNGWYLLECPQVANDTSAYYEIHLATGDNQSSESVGTSAYLWGAHLYRSDLGGMVDNPDRGDSYVPTTSSAKYLPRIGHHVYSSAWVNEGVLAESESRTNLVPYSDFSSGWAGAGYTITHDDEISPDGTQNASKLVWTTATTYHSIFDTISVSANTAYTRSVYIKYAGVQWIHLQQYDDGGAANNFGVWFDILNGIKGTEQSGMSGTIEDVGNGWYRCSVTNTTSTGTTTERVQIALTTGDNVTAGGKTGDGTSGIYIYGAQLEQASTPSSLIPTSGSSVTRAAETFTIPSANLPWPTPQSITGNVYSGTDPVNITGAHTFTPTIADDGSTKVVRVKWTQTINTGTRTRMSFRNAANSAYVFLKYYNGSGTFEEIIVTSTGLLWTQIETGIDVDISGITLEEINPLSVSIGMEGRMTYADEDTYGTAVFVKWDAGASKYIINQLNTNGGDVGRLSFAQSDGVNYDQALSSNVYSPNILVPYNIASRHGSTFINGAVDGVALTANTTPTALHDLSSTDLNLAYDYMGTISEFRVWDRDITDDGLVEATNPSLEPSLSLEFSGLGTNSFTVSDWSE